MSIEAMKQALAILKLIDEAMPFPVAKHAMSTLRTAIEQAEKQEPVSLETVYETIIHWDEGGGKRSRRELARRIVDLYTTPPAAQQGMTIDASASIVMTTHPAFAKRQWVGLTDEAIWLEYQRLWPFHPADEPTLAKDIAKFARAIEAKLKEKNT